MSGPLQHFTHIDDCSTEQLRELLQLALKVAADPGHYHGSLSDQLLINLFYEPSTRTRVSFETAAKRLGMHVVNVGASGSSIEKGETLHDTRRPHDEHDAAVDTAESINREQRADHTPHPRSHEARVERRACEYQTIFGFRAGCLHV